MASSQVSENFIIGDISDYPLQHLGTANHSEGTLSVPEVFPFNVYLHAHRCQVGLITEPLVVLEPQVVLEKSIVFENLELFCCSQYLS